MSVPRAVPKSVVVAVVLAGLWLIAFVGLNGLLLASYLDTGRVGMTWVAVVWLGFPCLLFVGIPGLVASYTAITETAARGSPRPLRRTAWAALAVCATGPAEALGIVILMCVIWKV